ncbi:MAG: hypothetical protein ACRCST_13185 [Turicibacter sp.]
MKGLQHLICVFLSGLLFIAVLYFYVTVVEPNTLNINAIQLETDRPETGYKIAFFRDTHFGRFYREAKASKVVEAINDQNIDLVIFTGDLMVNSARF